MSQNKIAQRPYGMLIINHSESGPEATGYDLGDV
jgi:hypothetical protein